MKHTSEQIKLGVKTIRELRNSVHNKTNESVTCITNRRRPYNYATWSIILKNLGVVRSINGSTNIDKEYWNQSSKESR